MLAFQIVDLEPQPAIVMRGHVAIAELPQFFGRAFTAVMELLGQHDAVPTGPPFGFYPSTPGEFVDLMAGFPATAPIEAGGDVEAFELPSGRAVTTTHVGPYENLEQTYTALLAWMEAEGLTPGPAMWEYYLSDPATEPPEAWRTDIVWPIAE